MKEAIDRDGYALWQGGLSDDDLNEMTTLFDALPSGRPGVRIDPHICRSIHAVRLATDLVAGLIGPEARVVRALLFDKGDAANWTLGWHQDRTIEPAIRIDVPGFGPWTEKQGRLHVAPPIAVVQRMMTARIHVDPVDADNAPLRVAPGSHRMGYVEEDRIGAIVAVCGEHVCLAKAGAIWLYATPILHASCRAAPGRRRRVLQLDFASDQLPGGLTWAVDAMSR